jgi:aldehyde dehydrogenase (NAD+)
MGNPKPNHSGVYIDGEWRTGGSKMIESTNPADVTEVVATVQKGGLEDARDAIDAAERAQATWRDLSAHDRGAYLHDTADVIEERFADLSQLVSREMGKTLDASRGELQRTVDLLNYYAEVARDAGGIAPPSSSDNTITYTALEPMGTVSIITPWNYPIAIPTWKIAPALIAGNTVVFKPASQAPAIASELARAFNDAGLPDGVLNFVPGSGNVVGDEFTMNDAIDAVSFTGSYQIGKSVQQSATAAGKRAQCEMGGKNPLIVDETADIDLAVDLTIRGGIAGLAGQACTATSRVLVFETVHDEYLDRLLDRIDRLDIGDPLDETVDIGPKSSEEELESDLEYIDIAQNEGARLVAGGERLTGDEFEDGHFLEPTVFTDVEPDMRIAQEEVFGPVLSVISVPDFNEAIEVANDINYGLSASICTNRLDHTKEFIDDIQTGVVKINQTTSGVEMQLPFGGRKNSSSETFKEQGRQALDFYTHEKAVYVTHFHEK